MDYNIDRYFGFIIDKYGFKKIPEYQYVTEIHNDFVKDNMVIKLVYNGDYTLQIMVKKKIADEIIKSKTKSVDLYGKHYKSYSIEHLDPKKRIYNSVSSENFPDKELWYFSKLLRENDEILKGDFNKLKLLYLIKRRIGLR